MTYVIEVQKPDGTWARMQWCSDYHADARSARRQAAGFEPFKLPVRVVGMEPNGTRTVQA